MQATTVGRTKAIEVREITIFLNKTDFISKRIFAPKNPNNRDKKTEKNDCTKVNFIISKISSFVKKASSLLKPEFKREKIDSPIIEIKNIEINKLSLFIKFVLYLKVISLKLFATR